MPFIYRPLRLTRHFQVAVQAGEPMAVQGDAALLGRIRGQGGLMYHLAYNTPAGGITTFAGQRL